MPAKETGKVVAHQCLAFTDKSDIDLLLCRNSQLGIDPLPSLTTKGVEFNSMNASQHCVLGDAKGLVTLHRLVDHMVFTLG